ncbi:TPA: hypothetical protein GDO54_018593 [Pyxicephalus adspersus]|uniref:Uncharacterized protein n=1 Tax=Pyxicephalus adspersus TaxID=30357 RepID=A0AAV2ZGF0_PYXAD|nr:TPA: hypothetical protein GDO54_018593 [Pyxicephalus adspersus]
MRSGKQQYIHDRSFCSQYTDIRVTCLAYHKNCQPPVIGSTASSNSPLQERFPAACSRHCTSPIWHWRSH